MAGIQVRSATLDDTRAISDVFRSHISVWQRVNAQGQVEDMSSDMLSIYERWSHGGAWMSIETAAIHLSHLLLGAGMPLVAVRDKQLLAYAEVYHGSEPAPYGNHLHLAHLTVHAAHIGAGFEDALLDYLINTATLLKCDRVTANQISNDVAAEALYRQHGLQPLAHMQRLSLAAKSGQGFYKAVEHPKSDAKHIQDWYMPIGRLGSAREQWETLWPQTFNAVTEIAARHTHRLHLSVAGQEAFMYCQQGLYAPRNADVYLWSPKPLTSQLLTAIRDWAHREGYRTLVMMVADEMVPILGQEGEPDGHMQTVYSVDVE